MKFLFDPPVKVRNFHSMLSALALGRRKHLIRENNHQNLNTPMIAKKTSPKGNSVRVTFELPADIAADSAAIAGTFNEWDVTKHPMTLNQKKGVWTKSISFKPGEIVEFRYFLDESEWHNEEEADGYTSTPYFSENSVLEL